ncbi:MAG: M16 family metallopeptidase [Bacteroidia bacterium]
METEIKLDRMTMPALGKPSKIDIIHALESKLPNGIPVYSVNGGTQDVVKIELIFPAGSRQQNIPLVADTTNAMLEEGTQKHNAEEIASLLDYYGSFLETSVHHDYASVALYSLGKHFGKVLPVLEELVKQPSFPQQELDVFLTNKKQRFLVEDKKVRAVAARNFPALLFGDTHPYGHVTKIEEYDGVKKENLADFHKGHYSSENCTIIAAGKIKEQVLNTISDNFGGNDWKTGNIISNGKQLEIKPSADKKHYMPREKALQSAIRMGRMLFLKSHADAIPFQILNVILGGYFGSRLMSNIREDKGYTYGISSGVVFLKEAGYFQLASEVGSDVCDKALVEIYKEMDRLCTEPVPPAELQLVKNYLRGNVLRSMDGPFALAERFKQVWLHGLDYSYYEKYISTLAEITSAQLKDVAGKYLQKDTIYELVVGSKKSS